MPTTSCLPVCEGIRLSPGVWSPLNEQVTVGDTSLHADGELLVHHGDRTKLCL